MSRYEILLLEDLLSVTDLLESVDVVSLLPDDDSSSDTVSLSALLVSILKSPGSSFLSVSVKEVFEVFSYCGILLFTSIKLPQEVTASTLEIDSGGVLAVCALSSSYGSGYSDLNSSNIIRSLSDSAIVFNSGAVPVRPNAARCTLVAS